MQEDIGKFRQEVRAYEDTMFGLDLYQGTSPTFVRELQASSYRSMRARGDAALERAKAILDEASQGQDVEGEIAVFEWPLITSDMQLRIDILLQCYYDLFPARPREVPLTEDEARALRDEAVERM